MKTYFVPPCVTFIMVAPPLLFLFCCVRVCARAPRPKSIELRAGPRARARVLPSRRIPSPNWTSSAVTGTISAADWSAAPRVRAHVLPAGCKRKKKHTGWRWWVCVGGGEITVLGEFRKSEYTDIMLHRGEAGTLVITWSGSLCQVSEGC